jgi:hypothetical protein
MYSIVSTTIVSCLALLLSLFLGAYFNLAKIVSYEIDDCLAIRLSLVNDVARIVLKHVLILMELNICERFRVFYFFSRRIWGCFFFFVSQSNVCVVWFFYIKYYNFNFILY